MAGIVVVGAGVIGLATGVMLAEQGHDVTVLERDDAPLPSSAEEAWQVWPRRGVSQFRQAHYLQPGAWPVIDANLPGLRASFEAAGAVRFSPLSGMPDTISDRSPREDDSRFDTLTARRPVLEYAVGSLAEQRIPVRRGVRVASLLSGPATSAGVPHVTGLRLSSGETLNADLVIDATGRSSRLPDWLAGIGAQPPAEHAEDFGFVYYTRYFRARAGGSRPVPRGTLLTGHGSFYLLTLPGDADTWSVTVFIASHDQALKAVRDPQVWTRVVAACPDQAHWLDGEPISDVLALGGTIDRVRRLVVEGHPVATGVLAVGDSSLCTNPTFGRGIAIGLMHAAATVEVVGQHLHDPLALTLGHDAVTEERIAPWFRHTLALDAARAEEMRAEIEQRPTGARATATARIGSAFATAMHYDADVFRAYTEIGSMLSPAEQVTGRAGLLDRVLDVAREHPAPPSQHLSRSRLLELVS